MRLTHVAKNINEEAERQILKSILCCALFACTPQ